MHAMTIAIGSAGMIDVGSNPHIMSKVKAVQNRPSPRREEVN